MPGPFIIRNATFRSLDLMIAAVCLVITSPLILLIVLIAYARDGAPIIFKQKRVGASGKTFEIFKFRTMVAGSDFPTVDRGASREALVEARARFRTATKGDTRVTEFGKVLRATHMDELPQLLNVILGDLSLVGVRPDTPLQEVDYPAEYWQIRHRFRPGITGPGQIYGSANVEERMDNEMQWLSDPSIGRYFRYLVLTIVKVVKRDSF